jgi:2-iminobutanoate/2-iminopropanoate deaminase
VLRLLVFLFQGGTLSTKNERRYINLPNRRGNLPFSDAVISGDTVYIAGRIGFKPGTTQVPEDPAEEARLMLDGVRSVLKESGSDMNDLVYLQIFCSDVSLFDTFNQVYRQYFSGDLPARAFIGSGPLLFGARFEIIGIAVKQPK